MRSTRLTVRRARELRRDMTPPEVQLWTRLRAFADGPRFRRQHPAGSYILDFYCPEAKLAVEVDGDNHNLGDRGTLDERRDAWLESHGITVLRIPAGEVLADPDEAAGMVWRTAMSIIGAS